jgi:cation diffusion facilitator family transporter
MSDHLEMPVGPFEHKHVFLGPAHAKNERKTWIVIGLCTAMMLAEIVGGSLFGSLALIADGWHMSTHAGALLLAALAYTYARRHAEDPSFTFGTGKIGDLAGYTSAIVLGLIAVLICYEAALRLISPVAINFTEAIPIALVGLAVNIVSAFMLSGGKDGHQHGPGHSHAHSHAHSHGHSHGNARAHSHSVAQSPAHTHPHLQDHGHDEGQAYDHAHSAGHSHAQRNTAGKIARDNNMRAAFFHVIADAAVSVLVIVGLLLARFFGWLWLDPAAGIIGSAVIASWSYVLIRDTAGVLLDRTADRDVLQDVQKAVEAEGDRLNDLHLWRLGPGHLGAIVSVATRSDRSASFYHALLRRFQTLSHITVEISRVN